MSRPGVRSVRSYLCSVESDLSKSWSGDSYQFTVAWTAFRKGRLFSLIDGQFGRCSSPFSEVTGRNETTAPLSRRTLVRKTRWQTARWQSERRNLGEKTETKAKPPSQFHTTNATTFSWSVRPHVSGTSWKRRGGLGGMLSSMNWIWKLSRQDVKWAWRKQRPRPATWCWSGARWVAR